MHLIHGVYGDDDGDEEGYGGDEEGEAVGFDADPERMGGRMAKLFDEKEPLTAWEEELAYEGLEPDGRAKEHPLQVSQRKKGLGAHTLVHVADSADSEERARTSRPGSVNDACLPRPVRKLLLSHTIPLAPRRFGG